ncbi:MAG: YfhO family protein [Clostridia bacterium]|nr:YfhO family protein [Clostridia bacterium]
MGFSYSKAVLLRPQKEKFVSTFLIALLTACAFFLPYMLLSEGYFIFYGDFNVQQIPFYQECHRAIREGNIFWSTNTDLGANFIGSYSFYLLGSPFFWLTLPFPNSFVPYLMGPLLILKFACAALTSYFYIRRFTATPQAARLGALLYAFSGFSVYNIFFNHFHEAIIFFPLLLLSFELLVTENRRFCFALTVCLCAISNYFFFYGMVVFTVIYFFVRLFSGAIRMKLAHFFTLLFEAFLGLALSAAMLLPVFFAISNNYRISETLMGWNAIMYGKEQIYANVLQCFFFPPDIPARPVFFPGANVKWSSLGGWLPLFSTVGLFVWFSNRRKSWLKRIIGISIFMALVPVLNSAFYAFNTSYYARWFYMPILMLCLATVTLTEDSRVDWSGGFKWVFGITLAVSLVIGFFPQENSEEKIELGLFSRGSSESDYFMYLFRFWGACLIALLSLIILWFLLKKLKKDRQGFYRHATVWVCLITVLYANVFIACGRSHSYEIKDVMIDSLIEGEVDLEDDSEFRVDTYDCVDNTSMYLGFDGINAFHSVVPPSIFEFYDYIGVERSVASRPDTDYPAIRPLLSVKYLLNRKDGDSFVDTDTHETEMPGYTYLKTSGGYYAYQNDNYIPYGFSYDYCMSYAFCDSYSGNSRAALMLKAILLTDEQLSKYGHLFENIENENVPYYSTEETSLSVTDEAMAYDSARLAETSAEYFAFDNQGFTARVNREKETLVFFSVPYDEGWSATVNGKKAEIEKVNAGFMAVKVDAGKSDIRFNYMTPGLIDGLKITVLAAAVLLLYIIIFTIYNAKRPRNIIYPEGEILLKEWLTRRAEEQRQEDQKRSEKPASILDDDPDITIPKINNGFNGGFKIDTDILDGGTKE